MADDSTARTLRRSELFTDAELIESGMIPGVTKTVLQRLRKARKIGFFKQGRTVFYSQKDIDAYLQSIWNPPRPSPSERVELESTATRASISMPEPAVSDEVLELERRVAEDLARRISTTPARELMRRASERLKAGRKSAT